jgi:hypothetical protein
VARESSHWVVLAQTATAQTAAAWAAYVVTLAALDARVHREAASREKIRVDSGFVVDLVHDRPPNRP